MEKKKIIKNIKIATQLTWFAAIVGVSCVWLKIWNMAFTISHYEIADTFIYVGVLGGWSFVLIFYFACWFFIGTYILNILNSAWKEIENKMLSQTLGKTQGVEDE